MDWVTPWLAVGSRADAADGAALQAAGVEALLSFAPLARPAEVPLQLSLAVADRVPLPPAVIRAAVDFLQSCLATGRRVLMHCEMGISRSPALAACFLHEALNLPLAEAFARVRAVRPEAEPHAALVASIQDYYGVGEGGTESSAVDLAGNENPLGPSPRARVAIGRAVAELHRYPPADTHPLRAALARRLGLAAGQILVGNGACDLIDLALRALVRASGEVLIPDPAFPAYRSAAARVGARVVTVPLVGGEYDLDAYLARLTPATRLVIVASPHNPTGTLLAPADWVCLRDALPPGAVLLLDEAYRDYAEGLPLIDAAADVRRGAPVLALRSLSKVEGLAGLRVGYGFAPDAVVARLAALCPQYHVGSLAQVAALAALEDEAHRRDSIAANARERERLMAGLAQLGVEYVPSAANFVLLRAPREALARLAARGIAVKDMARYGLPGEIRVSVGLPAENTRFLAALGELLREDHECRAAIPA